MHSYSPQEFEEKQFGVVGFKTENARGVVCGFYHLFKDADRIASELISQRTYITAHVFLSDYPPTIEKLIIVKIYEGFFDRRRQ